MKIPNLIDISPEVREEQKRYDDLITRETEISAKVRQLRATKSDGESVEDKESRIALVIAGRPVPPTADVNAELADAMLQWRGIEDAKEVQIRRLEKAKCDAGAKLCAEIKPTHDKIMLRLCASLTEVQSAWAELFAIKRGLLNKGIGLRGGICQIEPEEFLDIPTNRSSLFADFMHDAARAGYCRVPKNFAR